MSWLTENLAYVDDWANDLNNDVLEGIGTVGAGLDDIAHGDFEGGLNNILEGVRYGTGLHTTNDWLKRYLFPDPEKPNFEIASPMVSTDSAVAQIPVIYGARRVGGNRVFTASSGTNNEFLWQVFVLSEGEVNSIGTMYIDDIAETDSKYTGLVSVTRYTGTDAQTADAGLVAALPTLWTSAHRLRGLAYVVVKLTYNKDVFRGAPRLTWDVQGRKIYDTRTSTTAYSTNPAMIARDYLTNTRYGKGLSAALLDASAFEDAADACDTLIQEYSGGPNIKTHEFNGVLSGNISSNLSSILQSMRGQLPFTGGMYSIRIEGDSAPVMAFDDSVIIGGMRVAHGGKRDRLNRVKVAFANPVNGYQPDAVVVDDSALRAADNNEILETEIQLSGEVNQYRARYFGETVIKRSRYPMTCAFMAMPSALRCVPGDVVQVSYASTGWINKLFRVQKVGLRLDCIVELALVEHDATIYDRTVPTSAITPASTTLPDPRVCPPPTGLVLASGTSHLIKLGDGTIISRIYATWSQPTGSPYITGYEVEMKKTSGGTWLAVAMLAGISQTACYVQPVEDGVQTDVRVRAVNSAGVHSQWATSSGHVVIGKTAAPGAPSSFTASAVSEGVSLGWVSPTDTDFDRVEIWSSAINDRATATLLAYVYANRYTDVAAAGTTKYYWSRAIDTSGNPSTWNPTGQTSGLMQTAGSVPAGSLSGAVNWSTQISGTGKPADYADQTQSALNAGLTTTGYLVVSPGGNIRSGKTAYNDIGNAGWWIGNDAGTPKFRIGTAGGANGISFDGTSLELARDTAILGADSINSGTAYIHKQITGLSDLGWSATNAADVSEYAGQFVRASVFTTTSVGGEARISYTPFYINAAMNWSPGYYARYAVGITDWPGAAVGYIGRGNYSSEFIGFKIINGAVYGCTVSGGSESLTAPLSVLAYADNEIFLSVDYESSGTVMFSSRTSFSGVINNVPLTTNIPGNGSSYSGNYFMVWVKRTGAIAETHSISAGDVKILLP